MSESDLMSVGDWVLAIHEEARRYAGCFRTVDEFGDLRGGECGGSSGTFIRVGYSRSREIDFLAFSGHQVAEGPHVDPAVAFQFLHSDPKVMLDLGFAPRLLAQRGGMGDHDETWDLAWAWLSGVVGKAGREALPLSRIDVDYEPDPGTPLFIYGVTRSDVTLGTHDSGKPLATFGENGHLTHLRSTPPPDVTYRSGIDLFLQYDKRGVFHDRIDATASPIGMSGAGVWRVPQRAATFEPSEMKLIGIVRTSDHEREWIRATHIRHWIDGLALL